MKKLIFIIIIVLGIFLIYKFNQDNKIYYLSLSDELNTENNYSKYISDYLNTQNKLEKVIENDYIENMRTIDLSNMINNNSKITNKNVTIQNALIKADLVTLSIGNNDIIAKLSMYQLYSEEEIYNYLDDFLLDLDNLLLNIRKYCKEKIIFIGYYNIINDNQVDKYYKYLIKKVKKITNSYNIVYLDLYEEINKPKYHSESLYLNNDGYTYIGKEIVKILDNNK